MSNIILEEIKQIWALRSFVERSPRRIVQCTSQIQQFSILFFVSTSVLNRDNHPIKCHKVKFTT